MTWNKQPFSIYESEEKQVIGLIKELGVQTNYNTDEVTSIKESNNKKVSYEEMENKYKLDNNSNFTGSWYGIKKPTLANEGLAGSIEQLSSETIPSLNKLVDDNKTELLSKINEVASTGTTVETVQNKVQDLATKGLIQSYTLADKTINFKKLDEKIQNSLYDYNNLDLPISKGYYLISSGGIQTNDGYNTVIVENCKEGEKFNCDTVVKDSSCAVVIFFNDSWIRQGYLEKGTGTETRYINYQFSIPTGATKFVVSAKGINEFPIVRKFDMSNMITNRLKLVENKLNTGNGYNVYSKKVSETNHLVSFKYNNTSDIIIEFIRCGVSSLYQIKNMYLRPNTNAKCSGLFDNLTIFKNTVSDWLSPIKVRALTNINGDNINSLNYTGGWHGYNGDQTGARTGNFVSAKCYVDNVELTTNEQILGGNEVKIIVKNRINGYNTCKSDGSGRDILEEIITYTVTQGRIDVTNEIIALENVEIVELYGIQTENKETWVDSITFYGDISKTFDFTSNQDYYNKCDRLTVKGGENYLTAFIKNTGLGNRNYVDISSFYAWSRTYGKAYFNLVKNKVLALETGQKTYYQGGYIFSYGKNNILV